MRAWRARGVLEGARRQRRGAGARVGRSRWAHRLKRVVRQVGVTPGIRPCVPARAVRDAVRDTRSPARHHPQSAPQSARRSPGHPPNRSPEHPLARWQPSGCPRFPLSGCPRFPLGGCPRFPSRWVSSISLSISSGTEDRGRRRSRSPPSTSGMATCTVWAPRAMMASVNCSMGEGCMWRLRWIIEMQGASFVPQTK